MSERSEKCRRELPFVGVLFCCCCFDSFLFCFCLLACFFFGFVLFLLLGGPLQGQERIRRDREVSGTGMHDVKFPKIQ